MPDRVVVFDTSCLLCSRFINILLRGDKKTLYYTGFESIFSANNIPQDLLLEPETVVFIENDKVLVKSKAVMSILKYTRAPYRWLRIAKIFPVFILDKIYDWVAKNRYGWFGRSDQCYLPSPDQAARFLD